MKKMCFVIALILLLALTVIPAFAAETAQITITASAAQAKRGDEVTFTASISQVTTTSGFMEFHYNPDVFSFVSGECKVTGVTLQDVRENAAGVVVASYSFGTTNSTAWSGEIFTVKLRVKDGAAFAKADVTGEYLTFKNGTENVQATASNTSLTVVCTHSYGDWTPVDENKHSRECSICHDVPEAAHNMSVVSEVPASCIAPGSKTSKCSDCGHTVTEPLPQLTEHSWNSGAVTKKASCSEAGEKTFTCTVEGCGATYTEPIEKTSHSYDNKCDTDCNVCGATREITHNYRDSWGKNKDGHYHECRTCGHRKDEAEHTPGAEATEQTPQTCTVCRYIIKEALGHDHDYAEEWTCDETGHYHACSGCENQGDFAEHTFDNNCDTDCNVCGYQRETEHIYYENFMSSADGHWHECRICGYKLEMAHHNMDDSGICRACGYRADTGHTHSFTGTWQWDAAGHWQNCECGEKAPLEAHSWGEGEVIKKPTETADGAKTFTCTVCGAEKTELIPAGTAVEEPFPWWIVAAGVGALLVIGGGAFLIVGVIKGKKTVGKFSSAE